MSSCFPGDSIALIDCNPGYKTVIIVTKISKPLSKRVIKLRMNKAKPRTRPGLTPIFFEKSTTGGILEPYPSRSAVFSASVFFTYSIVIRF